MQYIAQIARIMTSSTPYTLYKHKIQIKYTPQVDPWPTKQQERLEPHPTLHSVIVTSAGAIVTSAGAITTSAGAIVTSAGASTHLTLGIPDECQRRLQSTSTQLIERLQEHR